MTAMGIAALEIELLSIFLIAAAVGIFVAKVGRFPYTIALLLTGLAVSVLGVQFDITLSHDIIFLVLLPPLLFEGAATMNLTRLRRNLPIVLVLATIGLLFSILILGYVSTLVLGLPLVLGLLFASMILPTDPVSVLALFKEIGAPERLSTLVEGESLLNDGVGVVVFSSLLLLVRETQQTGAVLTALLDPARLITIVQGMVTSSIGGAIIGGIAGYGVYRIMTGLDEHMTEIVLTIVLAYGSFVVAEHYFHVSGVIATVAAGLLLGNRGTEHAMSPQTKIAVFDTWETASFLVNTLLFLLIGATTPVGQIVSHAGLIVVAYLLVIAARAVTLYPLTALANRFIDNPVSTEYMHVMVWSGVHASISIALVLGLPATTPQLGTLRVLVFGVAALSLVIQGLSMGRFLDRTGVKTTSEAEELYELLIGKARAVDSALEALKDLNNRGNIPYIVYKEFRDEYQQQKEDLSEAISAILQDNPGMRQEEVLEGERLVLKQEKSAIQDAMRQGTISDTAGEELLEEIDIKLDRLESEGESIFTGGEPTYRWKQRAEEFGLFDDQNQD